MTVAHDRARALKTLRTIDPILSKQPVPAHRLITQVRQTGNHYNWLNETPPELKADLDYLHFICGLECSDGGYRRDRVGDYLLGKA